MKAIALVWIAGGTLWLAAGLVNDGTHEAIWLASDTLIAIGIAGLWRANLHSSRRLGVAGLALTTLGRAAFVVAEIVSAINGNDENALLPVGALATAIGMSLFGIAVFRTHTLDALGRFVPLTVGLYPFAAMFPIVIVTGEPSSLAISLWGVPIALLGAALAPKTVAAPTPGRARSSSPRRPAPGMPPEAGHARDSPDVAPILNWKSLGTDLRRASGRFRQWKAPQ
ncbi:MAG TPA: hypothetical protein VHW64_05405 [Nocardioides sp.]|jgi:hypothetical protein|uniref:hypothetical protein n=1 Tax=Nocardioides sp. TaxID=35761 RepID=UPI002E2EFC67|nr:hypothetical protein [Nocardioides sp.]HEX3930117.1 hypothetical protein [Nocardioides sp.]